MLFVKLPRNTFEYPRLFKTMFRLDARLAGWGFQTPVARAEYRSPTGGIQASPCLSPRRVVCARRVGERPVGRGTEEGFARSGACFLSVTFLCTRKEKEPAVGQPPTSSF